MTDIDVLLEENRTFDPPSDFKRSANVSTDQIYAQAARDPEKFWADQARELEWIKPWNKVLEWTPPHAKWFTGGKINVSSNCLDRHVRGPRRNKAALIWEGEPGDKRTLTYFELYRQGSTFVDAVQSLGLRKGGRVVLYLPPIPEPAVAVLSCAPLRALHTHVLG